MKRVLEEVHIKMPTGWRYVAWALFIVAVAYFLYEISAGSPQRAWETFLINTVFWGGMSQAGLALSAIWQLTDAKWGRPYKRIVEGFAAYLPVAFISFVAVFFSGDYLFEWVSHPLHVKEAYLNFPFFVSRNIVGILIMFVVSYLYLMASIKPDITEARRLIPNWGSATVKWFLRGETDPARLEARSRRLAPILLICHVFVYSMICIDYVMSLDQEWFSTLFPAFFLIGNLYTALALLLVVSGYFRHKHAALAEYITENRNHDLSKLTFSAAGLWTYMVFSQYIVIWYSNLPEETPYLVERTLPGLPWHYIFWALFIVLFVFPFLTLMPRTVCRNSRLTMIIGAILFVGQWMATYLLVVPSIQDRYEDPQILFGVNEVLITLGFGAVFFLRFISFMKEVPALPISDKHLCKSWHGR